MKKFVGVLLVFIMTLLLAFPTFAESPEIQGKELDQMLPMYYWMMGKLWDGVPRCDTSISKPHEEDNKVSFFSGDLGGRTFPNSEVIARAGIMLYDSEQYKDKLNALTASLIFAMEYTFEDTLWMEQPFDTISEELAPIVSTVLAGELYVSEPYVYYLRRDDHSMIYVTADHIDLYRAEHPEFSK